MMATLPWRERVGRFGGVSWGRDGVDGDEERCRWGGLEVWGVGWKIGRCFERRLGFGIEARLNMLVGD